MNNQIKKILVVALLVIASPFAMNGQVEKSSELHQLIIKNDSLLFNQGFNKCDIKQFENFLAEDLEFYHDKSGITNSKETFIKDLKKSLCNPANTEKINRFLVEESVTVYPLYNNGKLYGALQNGTHYFSQSKTLLFKDSDNSAEFSHLWLLENGSWKIKRVISYNHISR